MWTSGSRRHADGDRDGTVRRWTEWFLVDGHRGIVAGIALVACFVWLASVSVSEIVPWGSVQPIFYAFVGLITGNVTIVTVVVSISQLLLSKELKSPDELRSQVDGATAYRSDVEDATGRVPPVDPQRFLRLLFEATRTEARRLDGLTGTEIDDAVSEELDAVVADVTAQADGVESTLRTSDPGGIAALSVTLATDFADDIRRLRRLQSNAGDQLPDGVDEAIDDLVNRLQDIDVARQYFETIYLQEELAVLSRALIYVGFPTVVVLISGLFVFTAPNGASVSRSALALLVPAIITIGLAPLAVLLAFVLRIATVSQRTAVMLPFTTSKRR